MSGTDLFFKKVSPQVSKIFVHTYMKLDKKFFLLLQKKSNKKCLVNHLCLKNKVLMLTTTNTHICCVF